MNLRFDIAYRHIEMKAFIVVAINNKNYTNV